jgi:hypothetical protein
VYFPLPRSVRRHLGVSDWNVLERKDIRDPDGGKDRAAPARFRYALLASSLLLLALHMDLYSMYHPSFCLRLGCHAF